MAIFISDGKQRSKSDADAAFEQRWKQAFSDDPGMRSNAAADAQFEQKWRGAFPSSGQPVSTTPMSPAGFDASLRAIDARRSGAWSGPAAPSTGWAPSRDEQMRRYFMAQNPATLPQGFSEPTVPGFRTPQAAVQQAQMATPMMNQPAAGPRFIPGDVQVQKAPMSLNEVYQRETRNDANLTGLRAKLRDDLSGSFMGLRPGVVNNMRAMGAVMPQRVDEDMINRGFVPTIGQRGADNAPVGVTYERRPLDMVAPTDGAFVNGKPVSLRGDSEIPNIPTGRINNRFLADVAPAFQRLNEGGGMNRFQSPGAEAIAMRGPQKNVGPTTNEDIRAANLASQSRQDALAQGAAVRNQQVEIAKLSAQAQESVAVAKSMIDAGESHDRAVGEIAKAFQPGVGGEFDKEGFQSALRVAGLIPDDPAAQGVGTADVNGDGKVSAKEERYNSLVSLKHRAYAKMTPADQKRLDDAIKALKSDEELFPVAKG